MAGLTIFLFAGFLSLETNEIPGNMGFLDMLLALEWVNDHIRSFNGDKNCVTLMGQSAGGAAVTFFLTSPLVRDGEFFEIGFIYAFIVTIIKVGKWEDSVSNPVNSRLTTFIFISDC